MPDIHPVNEHARQAREMAEEKYLPRLERAYKVALGRISREARRNFRHAARAPAVVAAGQAEQPDWVLPNINDVIPENVAVEHFSAPEFARIREEVVREVAGHITDKAALTLDYRNPMMRGIIDKLGQGITNIADTTRQDIMGAVSTAYDEGMSVDDTAKAIGDVYAMSDARAQAIARTEFTSAQTAATLAGGVAIGLTHKTWATAPGAPHPRHEDYDGLDGQTVAIDDTFDVGGYPADHPGDPDLPPEEAVNCRCDVLMGEEADGGDTGHPDSFVAGTQEPEVSDVVEMVATMPTGSWESGTPEASAKTLLRKAFKAEPAITTDLVGLSDSAGGTMVWLEQRVKGFDSLTRKLRDKSAENGLTPAQYAKKLDDAVRYTMLLQERTYARDVQKAITALEGKGYDVREYENYWRKGTEYHGVHVAVTSPDGQRFELQFHTEASLESKGDIHKWYEEMRDPETSAQRKRQLWDMMVVRQGRVTIPRGTLRLGTPKEHKAPPVPEGYKFPNAASAFGATGIGEYADRATRYNEWKGETGEDGMTDERRYFGLRLDTGGEYVGLVSQEFIGDGLTFYRMGAGGFAEEAEAVTDVSGIGGLRYSDPLTADAAEVVAQRLFGKSISDYAG